MNDITWVSLRSRLEACVLMNKIIPLVRINTPFQVTKRRKKTFKKRTSYTSSKKRQNKKKARAEKHAKCIHQEKCTHRSRKKETRCFRHQKGSSLLIFFFFFFFCFILAKVAARFHCRLAVQYITMRAPPQRDTNDKDIPFSCTLSFSLSVATVFSRKCAAYLWERSI